MPTDTDELWAKGYEDGRNGKDKISEEPAYLAGYEGGLEIRGVLAMEEELIERRRGKSHD